MENKCIGCGAILQTIDPSKVGFIPKSLDGEKLYCKRCFRIKHYNEVSELKVEDDTYLNILHNIEQNALIIYIVDIFDFNGSFISGINRIVSSNDIILLGNKIDLFPQSFSNNKIKHWVFRCCKEEGLKVLDVELISALHKINIEKVIELINQYQKNRNVYVVGCSNVGKSSLINSLIDYYTEQKNVITTSVFPGTTLDTIEISMNDNVLVDTPGIINRHQVVHYLTPTTLKAVMPDKGIKPIIYQVKPEVTFFCGGFFRLDFIRGAETAFIFYKSNRIIIQKTKTSNADSFYAKHIGGLLNLPNEKEIENLGEPVKHNLKLAAKQDVVISGLGFFSVNKDCTIELYLPRKLKLFVRESII